MPAIDALRPPVRSGPPTRPGFGEIYYDTDDGALKWWTGGEWEAFGEGGGVIEETDPVAGPALAAHEGEDRTDNVHGLDTELDAIEAAAAAHAADTSTHGKTELAGVEDFAGTDGVTIDEVGGDLQVLVDAIMQPHIDMPGFAPPDANTGFTTLTAGSPILYGGNRSSTAPGAQNDEVAWDVALMEGTWALTVIHQKSTNVGIATVTLDAVNLGDLGASASTIDGYAGSASNNNVSSITGISIAQTGKKRLKFKIATRNASNTTGWVFPIQGFHLRRTA